MFCLMATIVPVLKEQDKSSVLSHRASKEKDDFAPVFLFSFFFFFLHKTLLPYKTVELILVYSH